MAYLINDKCTKCGACVPECPVDCITEGDDKYVISKDDCVDCGVCVGACPSDAIVEE
jgi:ferredoxin